MIKKIILWVVYAGIIGLLVFGAVNRTEAKADAGVGEFKLLSERDEDEVIKQGDAQGEGRRVDGQGRGVGEEGSQEREYQAQDEDHEWKILVGAVNSISEEFLEVELPDGEILLIEGQAWRYALANGFVTELGNTIEGLGFFEDGEFKISALKDIDTGVSIEVRDSSGRPMWAGRNN